MLTDEVRYEDPGYVRVDVGRDWFCTTSLFVSLVKTENKAFLSGSAADLVVICHDSLFSCLSKLRGIFEGGMTRVNIGQRLLRIKYNGSYEVCPACKAQEVNTKSHGCRCSQSESDRRSRNCRWLTLYISFHIAVDWLDIIPRLIVC